MSGSVLLQLPQVQGEAREEACSARDQASGGERPRKLQGVEQALAIDEHEQAMDVECQSCCRRQGVDRSIDFRNGLLPSGVAQSLIEASNKAGRQTARLEE